MRLGDLCRIVANRAQFRALPDRGTGQKNCELQYFTVGTLWTVAFQHHVRPIDLVTTTLPLSGGRHPYAD
jgi:hypothetical protein